MLLGPVLHYDLLTMARRPKHFVVRVGYALLLAAGLLISYSAVALAPRSGPMNLQQVAAWSQAFFVVFAWLQMLAVLVLTPGLVAASLARENERRTMEYLLASPLSSAEIVLGKLGGRLLYVGLELLSGLPVLALVGFLGGVSPEAMLQVTCVTLATAISLTGLSMWIGLTCRRVRDAVTRVYLLLFALLFVPWLLWGWITPLLIWNAGVPGTGSGWLNAVLVAVQFVLGLHPYSVLGAVTMSQWQPGFAGGSMTQYALTYSAVHGVVGLAAVAWGVWRLRRYGQRAGVVAADAPASRGTRRRWRLWQRPAVWDNALAWRELHADSRPGILGIVLRIVAGLALLGLMAPIVLQAIFSTGSAAAENIVFGMLATMVLVGTLGLVLVVGRAAASITAEKERETWVTLLSTPLSGRQIIGAKLLGAAYSARWWLGFLIVCCGVQLAVAPWTAIGSCFLMLAVGIHLLYAATLGLTCSLRSNSSLRAIGLAVGIAVAVGGGYLLCCFPVAMLGVGDESAFLLLAPCVPFHLATTFPIHALLDPSPGEFHGELEFWAISVLVGLLGYATAAAAMYTTSVRDFDDVVGRTGPRRPTPPR